MLTPKIMLVILTAVFLIAEAVERSAADSPRVVTAQPKATRLQELLKERLQTVREMVQVTTAQYKAGSVPFERLDRAMKAVLSAELDQCTSDEERISVLEKTITQAKEFEKLAAANVKAGVTPITETLLARAARLEVEIALERMKSRTSAPPK